MSKFKIKIKHDKYTGHVISMTRNGYQWSTIAVDEVDQLKAIRDVIDGYLNK